MVMSMKIFGRKKHEAKGTQHPSPLRENKPRRDRADVKIARVPVDAGMKIPHATLSPQPPVINRQQQPSRQQTPSRPRQQQQPHLQNPMMGASSMKSKMAAPSQTQINSVFVAETRQRTQAPVPVNSQPRPVTDISPGLDKYFYRKSSTHDSNYRGPHVERIKSNNNVAIPSSRNNITNGSPVKTTPRSILHTHQQPQQPNFTIANPLEIAPHSRVRFLSSSSDSIASSSCASQVHLMAGPGSVASSSAMSSSRGDAENVFDKVLHMVMAEEEDRLKAMGMSKVGPTLGSAGLSPAMYYKSGKSSDMYKNGGATNPQRDEFSPRVVTPHGMSKIAAAGTLINMDSGSKIDNGGNIECEYHNSNDEAIDKRKYRELLSPSTVSSRFYESGASGNEMSSLSWNTLPVRRSQSTDSFSSQDSEKVVSQGQSWA